MLSKTNRGFDIIKLIDRLGNKCSIQKSSVVDEDCLWIGADAPSPIILAINAKAHGIQADEKTGWIKYPLHEDVETTTRMHISRGQLESLMPFLINFLETGELT